MKFSSAWGSREALDAVLVRPDLVAEISADVAIDRGGVYRHPVRHVRLRLDVSVEDVPRFGGGMRPAHYSVHVEARRPDGTRHPLLRLGPFTQCAHTDRDVDQLNAQLTHAAPGTQVLAASAVPFDFSDLESYSDPYESDSAARLAAAVDGPDHPLGIDLSA